MGEPDRSVQTGGNLALGAAFRNDGRLLAVGTDAGEARICDVTMRSTLTTFSTKSLVELIGHGDVIRCTALWQENKKQIASTASISTSAQQEWKELAVTGSYDHTVRVWNVQNIIEPTYDNNSMKADDSD